MEKIKITVEQEKALDNYAHSEGCLNLEDFVKFKSEFKAEYAPLKAFSTEQFALLLCGWYEVEQPFEVGDWVVSKEGGYVKITNPLFIDEFDIYDKVTEPWKIMLLELGRENQEFHKDDVIVTESEVYEAEYLTDEEIIVLFEMDLVRAFHAAEHRIEVKGHDS